MTVYITLWAVSLGFLLRLADAGRLVSLSTTPDHAYYFVNDLGVNVKDGILIFDLTSTQDAIISLSQKQTLSGNICDVIFGSVGNTAIAVRENCNGCGSVQMASGISLSTVTPLSFWMDWTQASYLKVGQGKTVGQSELFTYTWTAPFEVNYVTATSYYNNEGGWNFTIDTPPVFVTPEPDGSTIVTVPEDSPISSSLLTLSAVDDEADPVTFYLTGGNSSMVSVQGADLTVAEEFDFEVADSFLLIVIASDGRHNVTAAFTLLVTDVIDEAPVLTSGSVTSVLEEAAVGTEIIGLFNVDDQDKGDVLTFSLEGSQKSFFSINETTGTMRVQQRIDREGGITRLDDLRVKVKDMANHESTLNLDLLVDDLNDNLPQFQSDEYTVNVTYATSTGTPVLTFNVTDADVGDNANVSLTLLTSQEGVWLGGADLYVNITQMVLSSAHAQSVYTVAVQASDRAGEEFMSRLTAVAFVHLQVLYTNDHTPVWTAPVPNGAGSFPDLAVSEDTAVSSQLLCLSARDDDLGPLGDVTYRMTSVMTEQRQNASDIFFLDPASGCLKTASVLDRDTSTGGTAYYLLTFCALDTGSKSSEAKLKITVTDVNDNAPVFSQNVYSVLVLCDTQIGSTIASLSASDEDTATSLSFSFSNGDSEYFELDSVTGDIKIRTNVTVVAEASEIHILSVHVTDGGIPEMTSVAVVVVKIEGCSITSGNSGDVSDVKSTNLILMVACGVLGAGLLTTTVLLCMAKATTTSPVKPLATKTPDTNRTSDRWSERRSMNSIRSSNSSPPSDVTVITDLTDSSSCGSLQFV